MDRLEKLATRRGNKKWTIQRNWQQPQCFSFFLGLKLDEMSTKERLQLKCKNQDTIHP
jgi:hypothetical protein